MEVEDGEDGALAGRGEGDADAPDAAPARPASASAITAIVLALGDAARAGQQRGDQARRTEYGLFDSVRKPRSNPTVFGLSVFSLTE